MIQIIKTIANLLFNLYYILILVRVLLSLIPHNRFHALIRPVYNITEPLFGLARRGLPPSRIGFDVSPFLVLVFLWIVHQILLLIVDTLLIVDMTVAFIGMI